MIYDTIAYISQYQELHPSIARGLRYLVETDFSVLPDGRHDIDGNDLFASIQSYVTRVSIPSPEAHRQYADIQYMLAGEEYVGVAPLHTLGTPTESHPDRDIWFYQGSTDLLTLSVGQFLILWPGDAHAPCIATNGTPAPARKCVVKVRL